MKRKIEKLFKICIDIRGNLKYSCLRYQKLVVGNSLVQYLFLNPRPLICISFRQGRVGSHGHFCIIYVLTLLTGLILMNGVRIYISSENTNIYTHMHAHKHTHTKTHARTCRPLCIALFWAISTLFNATKSLQRVNIHDSAAAAS